jgi:hypothetical protein
MLTRNLFAASVLVASLTACATDAPSSAPIVDDDVNGLSPDQIAELGQPASQAAKDAEDQAFAARMRAQADRAQAYLDQQVIPDFDRALRATANTDYATLQAEALAASRAGDPDAVKAALDRFYAAHGDQIDAAFASLGTTTARVTDDIRRAAIAGDVAVASASMPHTRGKCGTGLQLEPQAPFADAGWFVSGANTAPGGTNSAATSGAVTAQASASFGWGNGGGWVRSDTLPPVGNGWTSVIVQASFSWMSAEELLWSPAYNGAGVGLTIEMHDGPGGPVIGSCRAGLLDNNVPWVGYQFTNTPKPVLFQCTLHHGPTPFISTKVIVDAYAVVVGPSVPGFTQSAAAAQITSVFSNTCLD